MGGPLTALGLATSLRAPLQADTRILLVQPAIELHPLFAAAAARAEQREDELPKPLAQFATPDAKAAFRTVVIEAISALTARAAVGILYSATDAVTFYPTDLIADLRSVGAHVRQLRGDDFPKGGSPMALHLATRRCDEAISETCYFLENGRFSVA